MLFEEFIEPAQVTFAALVVLPPKKDGSACFSADYQKASDVSKRDVYLIPCMDECNDSLCEAADFFTLYARSGYWRVEIKNEGWDNTANTSHDRVYRFD